MEEYINLIDYLRGLFAAYNIRFIDEEELAKETSSMMEENTAKFIAFNQGRKDNKLSITSLDKELLQEMEDFLIRDRKRFSGMDIEKGYFNEIDALHLIVERWVGIYIQFLNSSKEKTEEDKKEEPQQGKDLEAVDDDIVLPSKLDNDRKKRKRGRPQSSFISCVVGDKDKTMEILHKAMKGKIGREAALIIRTAVEGGMITQPTFKAVEEEFGDIGHKSGYNTYMSEKYNFSEVKIAGAKKQLGLK